MRNGLLHRGLRTDTIDPRYNPYNFAGNPDTLSSPTKNLSKNGTRPNAFGLTAENFRTLRALKTPAKIQKFLDALPYQYADTAWSPQRALRERKGHCLEGALIAAA